MVDTSSAGESAAHISQWPSMVERLVRPGAPEGIICMNNSYSPNVSTLVFPKNEKVRDQWVK